MACRFSRAADRVRLLSGVWVGLQQLVKTRGCEFSVRFRRRSKTFVASPVSWLLLSKMVPPASLSPSPLLGLWRRWYSHVRGRRCDGGDGAQRHIIFTL